MNVIVIDTTLTTLGLCVRTDSVLLELKLKIGLKHSEALLPWVELLYHEAQISPKDVDLVVSALGPGSFTGLRIGISTAKGIAFGAHCPLVGVPTLDSLANRFSAYPGIVVPVYDAKKDRYYTAFYHRGERITDYLDTDISSIGSLLKKKSESHNIAQKSPNIFITGCDALIFSEQLEKLFGFRCDTDPGSSCSDPYSLLKLGIELFHEKGAAPQTLAPLYVRKSDAETKITQSGM